MVPKGIEALLDPNTLPGTPPQPTQPVATFVAPASDATPPRVEAPPEMPRITPRQAPAPAQASGIPALAQLRAQLTELETQLQQNPMAQLANQVAALTVHLGRIEAALGSVSKLAVALTTRLDEVGLAVGRIEESQERAAKQVPDMPEGSTQADLLPIDRTDPNVRRWKGEALANVDDVVALLAGMMVELPRSATLRVGLHGSRGFCFFQVPPDKIIGWAIREHFPEVGAVHQASLAVVGEKIPTPSGALQDLATAHHQACKLDWGGPVTWEVSVIGGTVFQCRTLEDALNEVQLRSFVSTLRAVRKTEGEPEETRRIYIASRPLDQVLAEIHKLHADPQWQPQTREGLAANAAEIGGSSAYQKVKDLTCPLCGAGPGTRCWKLNRKGQTTAVNCESPHRERREATLDHTGGVNDGN